MALELCKLSCCDDSEKSVRRVRCFCLSLKCHPRPPSFQTSCSGIGAERDRVKGQGTNEAKSLFPEPSVVPGPGLVTSTSAGEPVREAGHLQPTECDQDPSKGNTLHARVKSRLKLDQQPRMSLVEFQEQEACDLSGGEGDNEHVMVPTKSPEGADLLVEARENAVCENIFGLRANMVSQTKEIQSMNDNEFLRSLDILEAHVISLRKWNRQLSNGQRSDDPEWQEALRKLCDDMKTSTRLLGRALVSPPTSESASIDNEGVSLGLEDPSSRMDESPTRRSGESRDADQTLQEDQAEPSSPHGCAAGVHSCRCEEDTAHSRGGSPSEGTRTNTERVKTIQHLSRNTTTRTAATTSRNADHMFPVRTKSWGGRTKSDTGKKEDKGFSRTGSIAKTEISALESNLLTRGTKNQPFRSSDGCALPCPRPATECRWI